MVAFLSTGVAFADWEVGQPALYYQLPESSAGGWDVYSEWQYGVADDWTATTATPITDIHFWGSWKKDVRGDMGILCIQIFNNGTGNKPDGRVWRGLFDNDDANPNNDYTVPGDPYATSEWGLGFLDPRGIDTHIHNDHDNIWQYNIPVIENPFIPQAGHTYWLEISSNYEGCDWGWTTSSDSDNGAGAMFWDTYGHHGGNWQRLKEPDTYREPLGMAFVLTPEPATLFLMAIGAAAVLRKRRS
jgi:hypothetical protein